MLVDVPTTLQPGFSQYKSLRIQSPSEDNHYHDESLIGPPNIIMSQWDWVPRESEPMPKDLQSPTTPAPSAGWGRWRKARRSWAASTRCRTRGPRGGPGDGTSSPFLVGSWSGGVGDMMQDRPKHDFHHLHFSGQDGNHWVIFNLIYVKMVDNLRYVKMVVQYIQCNTKKMA